MTNNNQTNNTQAKNHSPSNKKLSIDASRQFPAWLKEHKVSFAFTTYQGARLFTVGTGENGRLKVIHRFFSRVMGLCANKKQDSLYLSSLWQIWRLDDILAKNKITKDGFDAIYRPSQSWTTGDLDIHDMHLGDDGQLYFINCLYGCLATLSEGDSFKPLWKPPFISRLVPEDRCHLNGLAMRDGKPKYVTCISDTDINDGWREHRRNGGMVIDIDTNEVVCTGLSMPHSPRWYRDTLYLHNSGTGEFGYVNFEKKEFVPLCFCPGYLRGLTFVGDFAVAGLSEPRHNKLFTGLDLDDKLKEHKVQARCGLQVIDLRDGSLPHRLNIGGLISELYDVVALSNRSAPYVIGTHEGEVHRAITINKDGFEE